MECVKKIAESFKRAKNFAISENKIIIWSKRNIFHANLSQIRSSPDKNADLYLQLSTFEIRAIVDIKEKKANKYIKKKKTDGI